MTRIVRAIERPPAEIARELAALGVATVHEANGRRGLMDAALRPLVPDVRVCGPAVTSLNHAGDNLMLHAAIEVCEPGDVLVVATLSPSTHGMLGELVATQCRARGIAAVILDAGARDSAAIRRMRYPVWARAISAAGTTKVNAGWVNVPVVCAGALVRPGDLVVADDDGVVVVAREEAPGVLAEGRKRAEREDRARERFAAGELSLDVNDLRTTLERLGVRD